MEVKLLREEELDKYSCLFSVQTVEEMRQDENFIGFVLQKKDKAIGGLAGYCEEDMFVITSLYVVKEYRREGGARLLLEEVIDSLKEYVWALRIDYIDHEGDRLEDFLDVCGFEEVIPDTKVYKISLKEISESPFFEGKSKDCREINSLSQLSINDLELLSYTAKAENNFIPLEGLTGKNLERDLSLIKIEEGKLTGCLLFEKRKENELILTYLWAQSKSPAVAAVLLKNANNKLKDRFTEEYKKEKSEAEECQIFVEIVNDKAEALMRGLVPRAKQVNRCWIYRML